MRSLEMFLVRAVDEWKRREPTAPTRTMHGAHPRRCLLLLFCRAVANRPKQEEACKCTDFLFACCFSCFFFLPVCRLLLFAFVPHTRCVCLLLATLRTPFTVVRERPARALPALCSRFAPALPPLCPPPPFRLISSFVVAGPPSRAVWGAGCSRDCVGPEPGATHHDQVWHHQHPRAVWPQGGS